jgi:glutathione S-transferase
MAKARVLRRREQLIAHRSALTAASPLGRVFLDYSHVVFSMFKVDPLHRSAARLRTAVNRVFAQRAQLVKFSNSAVPEIVIALDMQPKNLNYLESQIRGKFQVGNTMTLADIAIVSNFSWRATVDEDGHYCFAVA